MGVAAGYLFNVIRNKYMDSKAFKSQAAVVETASAPAPSQTGPHSGQEKRKKKKVSVWARPSSGLATAATLVTSLAAVAALMRLLEIPHSVLAF